MKNKEQRNKQQGNEDPMQGYNPTNRNFDHTEVSGDPHADDPKDQRIQDKEGSESNRSNKGPEND